MDFLSTYSADLRIMTAVLFLAISIGLIFMAIRSAITQNNHITRRLEPSHPTASGNYVDNDADPNQKQNLLASLGEKLSQPGAEETSKLRYRLNQAGFYADSAINTYYAIRVLAIIVPQVLLLILWGAFGDGLTATTLGFAALTLGVLGYMGPSYYINSKKAKRTQLAREGFPDMMDLLLACIEAGLALDAALARVSMELEKRYPVLKINMDMMNLELRAGRDRHQVLANFADRLDLEEARALATMIKQSEEMGSSMGKALRTFSDEMRSRRMLKAEEKALALSAKLTVPLILFIFPTIMFMMLLPAGVRVGAGLGGG